MRRSCIFLALIPLAITLTGCLTPSGGALPDQFLLYPSATVPAATPSTLTLGLRPVEAARPFQLQMAYLESGGRLNYYQTATWAEYPATMITRGLQGALDQSKRFADVGMATEMARPDLILVGYLTAFQENRIAPPTQAQVELRLELRYALQTELIWAETLRESEPVTGDGPEGLATAMQIAVDRLVVSAAGKIAAVDLAIAE